MAFLEDSFPRWLRASSVLAPSPTASVEGQAGTAQVKEGRASSPNVLPMRRSLEGTAVM